MLASHSFFQGFFKNPYANFQQYCVVPAEITAKVRMSMPSLSSLMLNVRADPGEDLV